MLLIIVIHDSECNCDWGRNTSRDFHTIRSTCTAFLDASILRFNLTSFIILTPLHALNSSRLRHDVHAAIFFKYIHS